MTATAAWIAGSECALPHGGERRFSAHTLWLAHAPDGQEIVLKRFADEASRRNEWTAYERYAASTTEPTPCLGQGCWSGAPVLVLRRLHPTHGSSAAWQPLVERALQRLNSIRNVDAPTGTAAETDMTRRCIQELLEPLRRRAQSTREESCHGPSTTELDRVVAAAQNGPLVFSHGDLHAPNIMCDAQGEVHLVDWERCAWMPAEADIAAITVSTAIRQPAEQLPSIFEAVRPHVRAEELFLALVLSEVVCLMDLFREDDARDRALSRLFHQVCSRWEGEGLL